MAYQEFTDIQPIFRKRKRRDYLYGIEFMTIKTIPTHDWSCETSEESDEWTCE